MAPKLTLIVCLGFFQGVILVANPSEPHLPVLKNSVAKPQIRKINEFNNNSSSCQNDRVTANNFSKYVQPILEKHCFSCHNKASAENELVDSTEMRTNKGLWQMIEYFTSSGLMPPPGMPQLTGCEKKILHAWNQILAGSELPKADR